MNKIKDLLLLVIAFTIAILLSINCHLADSAVEIPPRAIHTIDDSELILPTNALPVNLVKDGWQGPDSVEKELTLSTSISTNAIYGIDVSRTYEQDRWKYFVEHLIPPRDRYHHEGHLYYEGIQVPDGNRPNDFMITPFGTLYWHGHEKVTRYGPQGWMRIPNPRYPAGDEIDPVQIDDYDFVD